MSSGGGEGVRKGEWEKKGRKEKEKKEEKENLFRESEKRKSLWVFDGKFLANSVPGEKK